MKDEGQVRLIDVSDEGIGHDKGVYQTGKKGDWAMRMNSH